jgi:hypothetical protein
LEIDDSVIKAIEEESRLIENHLVNGETVPGMNMQKDLDALLELLDNIPSSEDEG